jgi:tetratricopeptide (TPR) repeat protein
MTDVAQDKMADLKKILANQKALGRRFLWLLLLPFLLTAIMLGMFLYTTQRVIDVEVVAKRLEIDRYLQMEGNFQWAVGRYEELAKAHPSASVLAQLGVLYFQADPKNREIAIATLNQAKQLNPKSWEVYRSLTYVYTASNQAKEAIETGKIALVLDGLDAGTYNNLAWCYATAPDAGLGNLALAESYALKAIDLTHDKHAEYFDTLARVYVAKGARDQAIKAFRTAIALASSRNIELYRNHLHENYPDENL